MMTPRLLPSANDEDLCIFARSGEDSRYLQTLVSPELYILTFVNMPVVTENQAWQIFHQVRPTT